MRRRTLLEAGVLGVALVACTGHTPYRQWKVYRQRHLLIGTSRADVPTYPLGKAIVAVLQEHLPQSSARVTRAPTVYRLGSLISTDQIPVLLVSENDARDLAAGRGEFAEFGPVSISTLYRFGRLVLVCRRDFPDHHAWLVTRTLVDFGGGLAGAAAPDPATAPVPIHSGALVALSGEPRPEAHPER